MATGAVSELVTSSSGDDLSPAVGAGKLRLMCSYGGQIIPRPHTKSLFYAGGDTRIVSVPYKVAMCLASLTSHLAVTLGIDYPFSVKYQLPHHDLDSLVSVATDEDIQMMMEENGRLSGASRSRIRLFLFPLKSLPCRFGPTRSDRIQKEATEPDWFGMAEKDLNLTELTQQQKTEGERELSRPVLQHPKTETWFVDALRSARIMENERNNGGGDGASGGGGLCGQESIVLETNSSFGSKSSSVSSSNLTPVKCNRDDNMARLMENKVNFASPESVTSENNSVATPNAHVQTGFSDELAFHLPVLDNKVSSNPTENQSSLSDPSFNLPMHKQALVSEYPPAVPADHPLQQQFRFIYPEPYYMTENPPGVIPVASYYTMYQHPPPQQPTQVHFQPQQPTQVHFQPQQPTDVHFQSQQPTQVHFQPQQPTQVHFQPQQPTQVHFQPQQPTQVHFQPQHPTRVHFKTQQPQQALFQPQQPYAIYYVPVGQSHQPYNLPMQAGLMATSGMAATHSPITPDLLLHNQPLDSKDVRASHLVPESSVIHPTPQAENALIDMSSEAEAYTTSAAHGETVNYSNALEDDTARAQIYKSQPPPPIIPSQLQTVLASEAFSQRLADKS